MNESRWTLFGKSPEAALSPGTIPEAQELVRQWRGKAIVPWGGGRRQHLGYPPDCYGLALSTANLTRITDYTPADMTVTVQAGMTLSAVRAELARNRQTLPLDAAFPDEQTIGGLIATRADNLTRWQHGAIRDMLLGVSVIDAKGDLIKGGGKVVKNVAGYDLPKLYCGSLGTLGLIVEASFKVAAIPEASATALLPLAADHNSEDALDRLLGADLTPSFLYLLNPRAAAAMLPGAEPSQYVVIGFDGLAESVRWQVERLSAPGGALDEDAAAKVRAGLRDFPLAEAPMTVAFHILSSQIGAFARMVEWTANKAGFAASVVADAAVGMMWAAFEPETETADWAAFFPALLDKAIRCGGSFVVERMPEPLRAADTPVWSPLLPDFNLMAGIKKALDPDRLWNPGRFVGRL